MTTYKTICLIMVITVLLPACTGGPGGRPPMGRGGFGGPQAGGTSGPAAENQREAMMIRQLAEARSRWDHNSDGLATCADVDTLRSRIFRSIDGDNNGRLIAGEYRHAKFEDKSFLFFDLTTLDINGSGEIDLDEFVATPHSGFTSIDTDGDCSLSTLELMSAYREQNTIVALQPEGNGSNNRPDNGPDTRRDTRPGGRGGRPGGQGGGPGGQGGFGQPFNYNQ